MCHWCLFLLNTYLIVMATAVLTSRGHDLWSRSSQMARAHDARLGYTEAQDQVVPPQSHVVVTWTWCTHPFTISWIAKKDQQLSMLGPKQSLIEQLNAGFSWKSRDLPGIYNRHEQLQPCKGVRPGIAQRCRTLLGQMFLSQQTEKAKGPGVPCPLCHHPHWWWAAYVVLTAKETPAPFY